MAVQGCIPSTKEAAAEGSQVQDLPGLHSEDVSKKTRVKLFTDTIRKIYTLDIRGY